MPKNAKNSLPGAVYSKKSAVSINCLNCGKPIAPERQKHKAKFCDQLCKDRYHSRGQRRLSKLEKRVEALENKIK